MGATWVTRRRSRAKPQRSNAIGEIEREIALVQEFRARLIADVVAGKLDVRAAAASLPEVGALEPSDEGTESEDDDEIVDGVETEEAAA